MENRDYKIFKEKINQINFENENVDNTLKKEFSTIFDLDKFDINNFTHYLDTQNKILLNKNILIHKNHSEIISQIDKATTLSLDKNINEIKEFQTNFEKERALVNQELTIYKENYKEEVFNLKINNETNRSENYAFYEEEISQILVEEKSLRNKYLIELNRLENEKELKLKQLKSNFDYEIITLEKELENLIKPYEIKQKSLNEKLSNELINKDDTYLTIKKTHNQSSIKFNAFIDTIKAEYKKNADSITLKHKNSLNDIKIDFEDLDEYFESIKEFIKDDHLEKIKALDIVFDVHKMEHKKKVDELIAENAKQISSINSGFRELRNNLNLEIEKLEAKKNKELLENKDLNERNRINIKYSKQTNPLKNQIIKLNKENNFKLIEQDIIFQTKIYEQDLTHLKHVNEWRYTKDAYDEERNYKLLIEEAKYLNERFVLNEKIKLEEKTYKNAIKINNLKMEMSLLPIESQLYFSSNIQSRDINLLNIEFDAFKLNNELELKLLDLNHELDNIKITHKINLIKESFKFDNKIIEVTYQLYNEQHIIERERDFDILQLQKDLQETLLTQKNLRQDNIVEGKINEQTLFLTKFEHECSYKIKQLEMILNLEVQKRNYIISSIKTRMQKSKILRQSSRVISLSKNNTEFNESINKFLTNHILRNYEAIEKGTSTFVELNKEALHPNIIRETLVILKEFINEVLKDNFQTISYFQNFEKEMFEEKLKEVTDSKYRSKHEDIINIYGSNKKEYLYIIDDLNNDIERLISDNKELENKIYENTLVINSIKLSSSQISPNEINQINNYNTENKSYTLLIKNNIKFINSLEKRIKVHNKYIHSLNSKEALEEFKLQKSKEKETIYYKKLIQKHNRNYKLFNNFLDNIQNKYEVIFSRFNNRQYLDDKNIGLISKLLNKYFSDLYLKINNYSFKLLSVWKKLHELNLEQENNIINKFDLSTEKALKENELNLKQYKSIIESEKKFINKLYHSEINNIENELKNISLNTNQNVTETHNTYHVYYSKTEKDINNIRLEAENKSKLVSDNLNEVLKILNTNKLKTISTLNKQQTNNMTKLLTNIILSNDEIKDLEIKTNERFQVIINKYNNDRKDHLNNLNRRRNSYNHTISTLTHDKTIDNEAFKLVVKRNLKDMRKTIKSLDKGLSNTKKSIRKTRRKESRENKRTLKNSLRFKNRQIRRKNK